MAKKSVFNGIAAALALCAAALVLFSCDNAAGGDGDGTPAAYKDFHNYPTGRQTAIGTLEIRNSAASQVLLFTDSVDPKNYIGTADSLNSIKVKLPDEKFYTIVAVDKAVWEEKGDLASQFSNLTYYSNTQPYSLKVESSSTYGGGTWYINNNTSYWVSFLKSDQSGTVFAVAAPNAKRVAVPVEIGKPLDYFPRFYKEVKYQGKVIALVESDQLGQADTVTINAGEFSFTTDIGNTDLPGADIKPAIFFTNNSDKSVRVYQGQSNQLSSTGMVTGGDFVLGSGRSQMFTSLEAGINTSDIQFLSNAWIFRVSVSQSNIMQKDKVYRIVLSGRGSVPTAKQSDYTTTVTEEEASGYFN